MNGCEVYCPICGACCDEVMYFFDDDGIEIEMQVYVCHDCHWEADALDERARGGYGGAGTDHTTDEIPF